MRIRSIKPEFWKSEAIARLPIRTRLTFIALWSYVDDNGVGRDIPQIIAGELFALEDDPRETLASVREDLARLREEGRITRYTVAGKPFLHITNWHEHQRIDKPNKPRYPLPEDSDEPLTCGYGESRDTLATPSRESLDTVEEPPRLEQGNRGTEEQGTGEVVAAGKPPTRATRIPDVFPFDDEHAAALWEWAREHTPAVAIGPETDNWRDWHLAKGDTAKDWTASWRTWMRRAQKDAERRPASLAVVRSTPASRAHETLSLAAQLDAAAGDHR